MHSNEHRINRGIRHRRGVLVPRQAVNTKATPLNFVSRAQQIDTRPESFIVLTHRQQ